MRSHPRFQPPELPLDFVTTVEALAEFCAHLVDQPRIGIDTEFVSERTFTPQLELIQISSAERHALIDCRAVQDLAPLFDVLVNPRVEKILHAGQQDIEIFTRTSGSIPDPIVDLQMAAAMAGFGAQPGYAHLVERLLGVALEKSETLTDWTRRPFTPAQIAYAVDDVRYILPLYERMRATLESLGRWDWLTAECARPRTAAPVVVTDEGDAYLRVRGRGSLRARGLAVLRALAEWRDRIARERNKPRGSVLRDEALVEIARKAPTTVQSLKSLRAVRSRELDRAAEEIVALVQAALDSPKETWPEPAVHASSPVATGVVELLQAVLRARAEQVKIAPTLLATSSDLQRLAQFHDNGSAHDLPVLQGWRREIIGEELLELLQGKASVTVDTKTGDLRIRKC